MSYLKRAIYFSFIYLCLCPGRALAIEVSIVTSSDIIPYNNCVEGIKASLSDYSLQLTNIEKDLEKGRLALKKIRKKNPKLIFAVGPRAAFVLAEQPPDIPRFFCMVQNPELLLARKGLYPGVSLNIPPRFQMEKIKAAFPDRKRVGVFFGPERNRETVDLLSGEGKRLGIELVPFPIQSRNDIPKIINSGAFSIDVLLIILDIKLRSTKILEYLIEESLRRKIPVVGYNSWFAKNGALLSFDIDDRAIGTQAGTAVKGILAGETRDETGILPPGNIRINVDLKTAGKLGIQISPAVIGQASEVIK